MSRDVPSGGSVPAGGSLPAADSKEEFAARLRALRVQAGSPSFRQLAKITNYSSSTLADATSGRRLPTESVVKALVTACGTDSAPWLEELRRISAAEQAGRSGGGQYAAPPDTVADTVDSRTSQSSGAAGHRPGRRPLAFLSAGAVVIVVAGFGIGRMTAPAASKPIASPTASGNKAHSSASFDLSGVPPFSGTPAPAPTARVADGTDPGVGHCDADVRLVDQVPVLLDGIQIGALALKYSPRCGAGWAEIYLYPGQPTGMGEATVLSADDRFSTMSNPLVKQVDVYTDVIVPGRGGCLGASGAVYEAGKPVVSASIPCESPTGQ